MVPDGHIAKAEAIFIYIASVCATEFIVILNWTRPSNTNEHTFNLNFSAEGTQITVKPNVLVISAKKCSFSEPKVVLTIKISVFIIWQSQSSANPCALIGSFSVRILQYGPFSWKPIRVFLF